MTRKKSVTEINGQPAEKIGKMATALEGLILNKRTRQYVTSRSIAESVSRHLFLSGAYSSLPTSPTGRIRRGQRKATPRDFYLGLRKCRPYVLAPGSSWDDVKDILRKFPDGESGKYYVVDDNSAPEPGPLPTSTSTSVENATNVYASNGTKLDVSFVTLFDGTLNELAVGANALKELANETYHKISETYGVATAEAFRADVQRRFSAFIKEATRRLS